MTFHLPTRLPCISNFPCFSSTIVCVPLRAIGAPPAAGATAVTAAADATTAAARQIRLAFALIPWRPPDADAARCRVRCGQDPKHLLEITAVTL